MSIDRVGKSAEGNLICPTPKWPRELELEEEELEDLDRGVLISNFLATFGRDIAGFLLSS